VSRKAGVLVLLVVLFLATAAPRGGFGGGRGGFGGGFGGGVRSRGSWGGFGGGYRGSRWGYGGPRFYFFGGRGPSPVFLLLLVGGIVLVVGGIAAANWYNSRFALVSLGVNLRRGERYARRLDGLLADSDFTSSRGRARALHRLAKMVEAEDVVDGFVAIPQRFGDRWKIGQTAETLARAQMQRIGITAEAINVANTEGQSVQVEAPQNAPNAERPDACVLALLVTLRRSALNGLNAGGEREALVALQKFAALPGTDFDALYFYYAPNAAEPLDPHAANRLFLDLRATATA